MSRLDSADLWLDRPVGVDVEAGWWACPCGDWHGPTWQHCPDDDDELRSESDGRRSMLRSLEQAVGLDRLR